MPQLILLLSRRYIHTLAFLLYAQVYIIDSVECKFLAIMQGLNVIILLSGESLNALKKIHGSLEYLVRITWYKVP